LQAYECIACYPDSYRYAQKNQIKESYFNSTVHKKSLLFQKLRLKKDNFSIFVQILKKWNAIRKFSIIKFFTLAIYLIQILLAKS